MTATTQRGMLGEALAQLEAAAQAAWADGANAHRWTICVRLSFAWPVSETKALAILERWAHRLRARIPGAALYLALHLHQGRIHVHGLAFIPRRLTAPAGCRVVGYAWRPWLQWWWRYGDVFVEPYRPGPTAQGAHGAARYAARDPGVVINVGSPPAYRPRRSR